MTQGMGSVPAVEIVTDTDIPADVAAGVGSVPGVTIDGAFARILYGWQLNDEEDTEWSVGN